MHSNEDYYKVLVNRKTRSISFELITVTFVLLKYSNGEKVPYAVICSFVPLALQTEDTFVSLSYLSKNLKQEEVGHGSHSHNLSSFLLFFFSIVLYFIVLLKKKNYETYYLYILWLDKHITRNNNNPYLARKKPVSSCKLWKALHLPAMVKMPSHTYRKVIALDMLQINNYLDCWDNSHRIDIFIWSSVRQTFFGALCYACFTKWHNSKCTAHMKSGP